MKVQTAKVRRAKTPAFEKLIPAPGQSFRCFNRRTLSAPAKWHLHPEIELTFVERGSGSRLVGDHIGSYRDNDLVLLGSNLPHTWLSDAFRDKPYDRHPAIVIQFHPQFLGEHFFETAELSDLCDLLQRAKRGLLFPPSLASEIGRTMTQMLEMPSSIRLITLLGCLERLARVPDPVPLASASYHRSKSHIGRTRIELVCNFIMQNLSDPLLDHTTLANLADMNPSAFSRFFKQSTGRTVTAYVTELRIGLACRLLRDTDDSILGISMKSGFSNLSNFNRRFRQHCNMPPRDYRAHYDPT